ncbi:response regulator [Sphingomonas sp. MAH-20]|uniref:Response regulator n=2 Tax=Sphingomonadaceae TaxID=41297 RepID=A0A6I4IYP4_9SPHN|nr:response regulator transcription factor [Sphingomonas sp. CGMCC 1.13658]MVO77247.1 response regulator [Sphingomonas horti]
MLKQGPASTSGHESAPQRIVYVVDDESEVRRSLGFFLKAADFLPRPYLNGADFLSDASELSPGCVLLDLRMGEIDGLKVIERLEGRMRRLPVILMTGHGDIGTAVRAMKLGAVDFLEKPFEEPVLVEALERAFAMLSRDVAEERERREAEQLIEGLTPRERDVLVLLSEGRSNKEVAIALDLSVRTVEMHRAAMFDRLGVRTLPEALRLAFRAGSVLGQPAAAH